MKLEQYPITDYKDRINEQTMLESYRQKQRNGELREGVFFHHAFLTAYGPFECDTKGVKESVLFSVFLLKIKRDNRELMGLKDRQKQLEWFNLTQAFIDDFGDRTPPDVIAAHESFKEPLGL